MFGACTKDKNENTEIKKSYLDTLTVTHSMKGWEIYSWPSGNERSYSILVGTNRIKSYEEVTDEQSAMHLITVRGVDTLKLVLDRFPEAEYILLISQAWLQNNWGGNYGNLCLPPKNAIDDISVFCTQKKLNLHVTD